MEVEQIIKLMEAVSKNGLTELSYEENGVVLKLKKSNGKVQAQPPVVMMGGQMPSGGGGGGGRGHAQQQHRQNG